MAINMTEYMPFDSGPGADVTEDGWRAMMRRGNIAGVVRGVGSEMRTYGNSTGMQVMVSDGEVVIESYWGRLSTPQAPQPLSIISNTSGSVRYDVAIVRADWVNNVINLDILTGTPGSGPPAVTRNTSKWEIPLAIIKVASGVVTINAADVQDARQWGGPPVVTNTDDFLLFGDRISTCSRYNVGGASAVTNGLVYFSRLHSPGEQTVSTLRLCPSVLPVGGTTTVRIFRGPRGDQLTSFVDPTTSNFLYGGSVDDVHSSAIPSTSFRAGEVIVIAVYGASTTTSASLVTNAVVWSGGNASKFLNPSTSSVVTSGFKSVASMPTTLNIFDGSWTLRDRVFWAALA